MGNTEVCPIAVNPTERCICTLLSTNGDFVVITRYLPRSGDKMGARNTHSMSHRLKKRRACFVSGGVDGRSDCWGFVRPTTLLGQKKQRLTLNTANLPCYSLSLEVNGSNCQYLLFDSIYYLTLVRPVICLTPLLCQNEFCCCIGWGGRTDGTLGIRPPAHLESR